ncbi:uncharacterized protein LOC143447062 isoform X1 [Clavelina lepadiformis]|uniref:uncharacterized protein LOC143447062 isoform X1 n=1 Tax=Clavelina lepadiformis TaxID=159417 RepID=UPI00404343AC
MEETFRTGRATNSENSRYSFQMHSYHHTESDSSDVRQRQNGDLCTHTSVIRSSDSDEIERKYLETQKLNDLYKDQIEFLTQQLNIVVEVAPPEGISRDVEWQEGSGRILRIVRSNVTTIDQEVKLKKFSETVSSLQKQLLRVKSTEDKMQELILTTNEKLSAKDLVIEKLKSENSKAFAEKKNYHEKLTLSEKDRDMNRENLSNLEAKCRKLNTMIQQTKADMDNKTSATREYEVRLKEASQRNNHLSKENEFLQTEINKLIKKSLDFEKTNSETNTELTHNKNIVAELEENNANLKQHVEVLTMEADNKTKGNEAKLLHMMKDIEVLKKATTTAIKEKSQENVSYQQKLQTLAQRYETQQNDLHQQLESTGHLQEQLNLQLRANANLQESITIEKETSQSLQTDLEDKQKEIEKLRDLQKQSIISMERSKDSLHDKLNDHVAEEKERFISRLKKDNDMLNAKLTSLQQRLKSLQASRTTTQVQPSSLEKGKLRKENSNLKEEINRMKTEGNLRTTRTITAERKLTSETQKALTMKLQKANEINKASEGIIKRLEDERVALNKTIEELGKDYKKVEEMYKTELKVSRSIKKEDDSLSKAMENRLKWTMVELERQSTDTNRLRGLHAHNEEKLTGETKALQDKMKSLENRVAKEINDHSATTEKLQGCRLALSKTHSELNELQQALQKETEAKEANMTALDELRRTYESLQRSEQTVREELKKAKDGSRSTQESLIIENMHMEKENAKLEQNIEQLQDQLKVTKRDMQDELMQSRDSIFELESENKKLENELNTLTSLQKLSERNSEAKINDYLDSSRSLDATIDNLHEALQHSKKYQDTLKIKQDEMAKKTYVLEEKLQKHEWEKEKSKEELEHHKAKNTENEEALEDLRTKVESLERALSGQQAECSEWKKRHKTLQEEIKTLQQKTELVDTLDTLRLKRDLTNSRKTVSDLRQENESLKKKVLEAQKTNDKEIEKLTNYLQRINNEKENLMKELENDQNVLKQKSEKINTLELEKQRKGEETHDLRRKSAELLKDVEDIKRKSELLSKENKKQKALSKTLQDENANLKAEIDVVNAKMSHFNQQSLKEKEIKTLRSKLSQLQNQHEELKEAMHDIDKLKDDLRVANITKEKCYSDLLESLSVQKQHQNEIERLTRINQELQDASDKQNQKVVRFEKIQLTPAGKRVDKTSTVFTRKTSSDMKNENAINREDIESLKQTVKALQASDTFLDTEVAQSKEISRKKDLTIERLHMKNSKQSSSPEIALPATYVTESISSSSGNFYNEEATGIRSCTNDQQAKKENTEVATGSAHTEQSEHAIEEMKKKRHETEKQSLLLKQQVERLKIEDNASLQDTKSKVIELQNEIEQLKIGVTVQVNIDEVMSANEKLQSTQIKKENQIKAFQVTVNTSKDEIAKLKAYRASSQSSSEGKNAQKTHSVIVLPIGDDGEEDETTSSSERYKEFEERLKTLETLQTSHVYGQDESTVESIKKRQLEQDRHNLLRQKGKWKEAEAKLNKKITTLQTVVEEMSLPEFRRQPSSQHGEDDTPYNNLAAENALLKEKIRDLNVQLETEKIKRNVELSNLNQSQLVQEELIKAKEEKLLYMETKLKDFQQQRSECRSSSRSIDFQQDFEMQHLKKQGKHRILENLQVVKDDCALCAEIEKENKELREEMDRLRSDLSHYDGYTFNEVDDLRYNYSESVKLNVLYEDQLRELSQKYGVPICLRVDEYDGDEKTKDGASVMQIDGKKQQPK